MPESADPVLKALLDVLKNGSYAVPEELVRQVYEIERTYQFDDDEELRVEKIRRTVNEAVAKEFMARGGRNAP